jgi:hypothetical protein
MHRSFCTYINFMYDIWEPIAFPATLCAARAICRLLHSAKMEHEKEERSINEIK